MIYLDTSSLLKLFYDEPESAAVGKLVAGESDVIISALTRLEAQIQIKAAWLAGSYGRARYQAYAKRLDELSNISPFRFLDLPGSVFSTARRQDKAAGQLHSRILDRLHLAAMEDFSINRLMTNDAGQAAAAKVLGYEVAVPR